MSLAEMPPTSPLSRIMASLDATQRRELPMPSATKAGNIEQAQATLFLCSIKLRGRVDLWAERPSSQFIAEGQAFRSWLESWETAFSALLSNAMPSMHQDDVDRCRVIKANHLSCVVLAALLESSPGSRREAADKDCLAIVGLATAVLDGRASQSRTTKSAMTMAEPLVVVQSYCGSATLRDHASNLLARHYNAQDVRQQSASSISPASSVAASSPRSVLSQSFGHSRTSSQGRYSG